MNEKKQLCIQLDADTWQLLESFCRPLGQSPEAWVEHAVTLWLGHPAKAGKASLGERLRRLEAPVRSWPEMEITLERACLGEL